MGLQKHFCGEVWSGSALFAYAILSETLVNEIYTVLTPGVGDIGESRLLAPLAFSSKLSPLHIKRDNLLESGFAGRWLVLQNN